MFFNAMTSVSPHVGGAVSLKPLRYNISAASLEVNTIIIYLLVLGATIIGDTIAAAGSRWKDALLYYYPSSVV